MRSEELALEKLRLLGRRLSCGTAGRLEERLATAAVGADAAKTAAKTEIDNKDAGGWGLE